MSIKSKRILSLFLVFVFLLSFSACSPKNKEIVRTVEPISAEHVWRTEDITLPAGCTVSGRMILQGNTVLMDGAHTPDGGNNQTENIVLRYDPATKSVTYEAVPSPASVPENASEQIRRSLNDGGTAYLYTVPTAAGGADEPLLIVSEPDGSLRYTLEVRPLFANLAKETGRILYIQGLEVDTEGNLYLFSRNAVTVVSASHGYIQWQYKTADLISNCGATADGRIYLALTGEKEGIYFLDGTQKTLGSDLPTMESLPNALKDTQWLGNCTLIFGAGYDMYFANCDGLYGINLSDHTPVMLCDWLASDISFDSIDQSSLTILSPELVFYHSARAGGAHQLSILTPVPPEEVTPKYLIRVGFTRTNDLPFLREAALSFNRKSTEFRIALEPFTDDALGTGVQTSGDKLREAVITGSVPDMMICYSNLDYMPYVRQGLFRDLSPLLDDPSYPYSRDDFLSCIEALSQKDGTLPLLMESFLIDTMYMAEKDSHGKTAWTLTDYLDAADTLPGDAYLLPAFGPDSATLLLYNLQPCSLDDFIDWQKGTCSFDSALFGRFLTYCKDAPAFDRYTYYLDLTQSGKMMICPGEVYSPFESYLQIRYVGFSGQKIVPIGYPTQGKNGSRVIPEKFYGITAESQVYDGAWEFICQLLQSAKTDNGMMMAGMTERISAFRSSFDAKLDAMRNMAYFFSPYAGYSAESVNGRSNAELQNEAMRRGALLGRMTEEDENTIRAMVENIREVSRAEDRTITALIIEDASLYFSGEKTLEETQKIIQSRLSLYVSERAG